MNLHDDTMIDQIFGTSRSRLSMTCWLLWGFEAILFAYNPYSELVSFFSVITLSFSVLLAFISPLKAVYLLPTAMLLGPIYSITGFGLGIINSGDIVAFALIVSPLLGSKRRLLVKCSSSVLFWCIIFVGSTLYSLDFFAALSGLLKIIQFILIIWVANSYIDARDNRISLFISWIVATTISSILMAYSAFAQGPQFLLNWTNPSGDLIALDLNSGGDLLRLSYFYSGIHIPIGLTILTALWVLLKRSIHIGAFAKWLLIFSIFINSIVLVANNTRAMLIPVVVVIIYLVASSVLKVIFTKKSGILLVSVFLMIPLLAGVFPSFNDSDISVALTERSLDASPLQARIELWESSLIKLLDYPIRFLLTGFGAQATARQNSPELIDLRTSFNNTTEGAFDSTIIGVIVEFGLLALISVIIYLGRWFKIMYRAKIISGNPIYGFYIVIAIVIIFASIFQQIGFSPAALMVLQLFAFRPRYFESGRRTFMTVGNHPKTCVNE